jgi:hypothetical protein
MNFAFGLLLALLRNKDIARLRPFDGNSTEARVAAFALDRRRRRLMNAERT